MHNIFAVVGYVDGLGVGGTERSGSRRGSTSGAIEIRFHCCVGPFILSHVGIGVVRSIVVKEPAVGVFLVVKPAVGVFPVVVITQ